MLLINRVLNRRAALVGLSAAGLVSTTLAPAASGTVSKARPLAGELDPTARPGDKALAFQTLIRMMASTVEEDCTWFYRGTLYAQVGDAAPTALCGLIGAETYWPVRQPNGDVVLSASTFSYPTPLFSEETLEEYANPFTGERNRPTPNLYRNDSATLLTEVGMVHVPGTPPDPHTMQFTRVGPWLQMQHDVGQAHLPQPHREINIIQTPLAEITDPKVHRCTGVSTGTFISRWPKWMNMTGRPGHVIWSVGAFKVASPQEMPQAYLSRVTREHPNALTAKPGTAGRSEVVY